MFPEVVFRTLDDEDGDEGIWSILVSEGYLHHRVLGSKLRDHVPVDTFPLEGDEGSTFNGRLDKDCLLYTSPSPRDS